MNRVRTNILQKALSPEAMYYKSGSSTDLYGTVLPQKRWQIKLTKLQLSTLFSSEQPAHAGEFLRMRNGDLIIRHTPEPIAFCFLWKVHTGFLTQSQQILHLDNHGISH